MRNLVLALFAALSISTAVQAADDPMASAYGNTLVIVDANGVESHIMYSADHSFKGTVPSADYNYKGTWAMGADGKVCRTYSETIPGVPNPDCDADAAVAHAVGDAWTSSNRGMTYKITLKSGAN